MVVFFTNPMSTLSFFFFSPHPRICLLTLETEGGGGGGNIDDVREKH